MPIETTNQSVSISISTQHLSVVLEMLLKSNIPFTVSYAQEPKNQPLKDTGINSTQPTVMAQKKSSNQLSGPVGIFQEQLNRALETDNEPFPTIEELMEASGITTNTLKGQFRKQTGQTLYSYYLSIRMQKAAQLLKKGYRANAICQMIGYGENSAIKFNKMFQKHFGITPKKYQMKHFGRMDKR